MKIENWATTLSCAALFAISTYSLYVEILPFFSVPVENETPVTAVADDRFSYGLSSFSKTLMLRSCARLATELTVFDLLEEMPRAVLGRCEKRASEIVARKPTDSFAWLVKAMTDVRLFSDARFNNALKMSQATGPNELWLVDNRIGTAEQYRTRLDAQGIDAENADFRVLAYTERGVQWLVGQYVARPAFRERIASIFEKLPVERQGFFLRRLKQTRVLGG